MKYIKQFFIISMISFAGEILHAIISMPIPASIYGIIILFMALELKIIPLGAVKETGKFLVEILPIMFVPASVGLMDSWGFIKSNALVYIFVTVITTFLVMIVSGLITQILIRSKEKKTC